ncbi:MAG TPA: FkbM family methyltransferase [Gemmatimonadales bacterium]|nr:FkbM family methyltransferase [Gemmatimonadales bacterium]
MPSRTARCHGFTFHYRNEPEFELLSREIFEEGEYWFSCERADPTILDCGSHIGLSIAWFKHRFPRARITAFEPDPETFQLLQTNVAVNRFDDVELLNLAVAAERGAARFYGEFGVAAPMASAHSLRHDWGTQRSGQSIVVNTVPLSDYITGPVDYLKVDIEGAEIEVMASVQSRLHLVRALGLEFHGTGTHARADEEDLVQLLRRTGFDVAVTPKSDVIFPPEISGWVDRVQPYVSVIKAARRT